MNQLKSVEEAIGKTIKGYACGYGQGEGGSLLVGFEDGSYLFFVISSDNYDSTSNIVTNSEHMAPAWMLASVGLITRDEAEVLHNQRLERQRLEQEQEERELLARLKAKYEGVSL